MSWCKVKSVCLCGCFWCIQIVLHHFLSWHIVRYSIKVNFTIFGHFLLHKSFLTPSCSGVVLYNRRYAGTGEKYFTSGILVSRNRIHECTHTHTQNTVFLSLAVYTSISQGLTHSNLICSGWDLFSCLSICTLC